ncbi:hypothetical protein [Bailinhaonella thermotolerans]|uniref:PH domain-containing protein n=1 Tax=Bailinhaonella thermotolerans TaxID=1070861 RepID=A0A3A4B0Y7_9ACTN|nr:hypothetical protein [Bailinhaonella thermotolerans]RJL35385.1 hypothetical protein D5H75_00750 [Bailinhaonella thermotolerans]
MREVQGDLTIRPDVRKGLAVLVTAGAAAVAIVAAILIGDAPAALAAIMGGFFAALIALAAASLLRSRVVLTSHEIILRGPISERRRPRARAARAVRATLTGPKGGPGDTLFILDAHHNVLLRVSASMYGREQIDHLVAALGVPCSGPAHPVTAAELSKTYPGLFRWPERHPYLLGFAIAATVLILILAFLALIAPQTTP